MMTLDGSKMDEGILFAIQQEYKVLAEYKMVESESISGVYVIPSFYTSLHWFGVIFVRDGHYKGGVFRFSILLPDKFPDEPSAPSVIFQNDIIHPMIHPYTKVLDISQAFPSWRSGEDHIWQLLKYIKAIFLDPSECVKPESLTTLNNEEAGHLFLENNEEFKNRVAETVKRSVEQVYDVPEIDDPHYIVFERYDSDIHGPVLKKIKSNEESNNNDEPSASGLSWVKEGEYQPLSIE